MSNIIDFKIKKKEYVCKEVQVKQNVSVYDIFTEMPIEEGLFIYKCMENDYEWEFAAIISDFYESLFVHEQGLGITNLKTFHDNLTDLEWSMVV